MDFRLLGPLEVVGDTGLTLQIGTGRQRALLALLLLRANEQVTRDRLIEELWGESPPATAHKMLHNQVSALRQALGRNGRLETNGSSYRLNVQPGELDVDRFEELLASARDEIESDPSSAAEKLTEALGLWRGPPLSDLAYEQFAQTEIARLEERRWVGFEARMEAELALGRHADLVPELEAAVAEQPLREHLRAQLMLALYRCGRQADALEAYRSARRTLVEQVGLEPGAELRALQDAIFAQDPALDPPREELPEPLEGGSPLLAGRDRELAELTALLGRAEDGHGGVVLVHGPRGIGKTRLAAELAREALRRRIPVLYAGASTALADGTEVVQGAQERDRPKLLVLDDADPELLECAASAIHDGSSLLVAVFQLGSVPPAAFEGRLTLSLELGPLGDDAAAEIAHLYLPAGAPPPPAEALSDETGGVPSAVHRVAVEWARAHASREAEASAGRAARERGELRAAEADLSDDLLALLAVDERDRLYRGEADDVPLPAICPFLGLASFDAAHAEYFFGRERLVAELVARLAGAPLLALVGPSGAGKSSALRAGLLPALASGVLPGSEGWVQAQMRPGGHPLAELGRALPAGAGDVLLAVDQFEELFTACRDERERAEFIDALVALARASDRRVQVVIAVRADFYGRCAANERLARLVGANHVLVGPMRRDELRRAIVEPARLVGLRVEPSLTDALIGDVLDEPGGLPLLSAALLEQWRERDGRVMRRAAYERTGGVRGAVGRLAESTYARLSADERRSARRILLRLADAGEHEDAFVRRRVPLDELELERDEQAAAALAALTDSRLVTADEGTVEVAHEALLSEWPRLREWLEEDAEGRRLHQHLIHAARDWASAGRDPGELYRGARLASTLDWATGHERELNELERAFLDESRAEAEHEAEHQRRTNRRLRGLLAGLAGLLALALVAGIVALNQRGEARDAARVADAQRLGVEALGEERLDQALLRTRTSVELDESPATLGNMLSVLLRNPAALGVIDYGWMVYGVAISPDGELIATGDESGAVNIYDAASRRPVTRPYRIQSGLVQNVSFSPDGRTLAVSYMDMADSARPKFDLLDVRSARRMLHVELPRMSQSAFFAFTDIIFPPDERELLAHPVSGSYPDAPAAPVYRVDRQSGELTGRVRVGRLATYFYGSEPADRRSLFLTSPGDDRTWQLDTETLRVVRSWPVGGFAGAVSPDGTAFALTTETGELRLLDLASGDVRPFSGRHDDSINRIEFTPDGRRLVTADVGGNLYVWDVQRGTLAQRLPGHVREINGLDISPDGRTLLTGSNDTRVILWDLAGDTRLDRRFAVGPRFKVNQTPRGIAVSPNGRTLAFTHSDGSVDLLDTQTLQLRGSIQALDQYAASVAFSPDGRLLAVTGKGGRVTLWNPQTLAPAGELEGMRNVSQALAFSPDGTRLAGVEAIASEETLSGKPRPLRVWDLRSRTLTDFRAQTAANLLAYSPSGRLLAAATQERGTEVRDASTGRLIERLGGGAGEGDYSRSVVFSPDGELLFVGQYNGTGRLFSTDSWRPVGQPLEGAHTGRITFGAFTPDGKTLVTSGADGRIVLWDVERQAQIGAPLEFAPNTFASVALSPDGSRLYAVSSRGEGISFDMSHEAWKRHACLVAGRELTPAEWNEALPDRPYQTVCSSD